MKNQELIAVMRDIREDLVAMRREMNRDDAFMVEHYAQTIERAAGDFQLFQYGDAVARNAAVADQEGGAKRYDDRIIRARLAQAFGRLIRTREDSGHFVVLSPAFPSRLLSAFPEGTPVTRLTLEEALQRVAKGVVSPEHSAAETQPQ